MIKVVVAEDMSLTRMGLVSMIKACSPEDFLVVGEADNGKDAVELIKLRNPDVVFTDVKMPVMNGIEVIRQVQSLGIHTCFVVLSAYNDYEYVHQAMTLGVEKYLMKLDITFETLKKHLDAVKDSIYQKNPEIAITKSQGERFIDHTKDLCSIQENIKNTLLPEKTYYGEVTDELKNNFNNNISMIEEALRQLKPEEIKNAFSLLKDKIFMQRKNLSLQSLYGVCYTLIYIVDQFNKKLQIADLTWNRTEMLENIMSDNQTIDRYLEYIDMIKEQYIKSTLIEQDLDNIIKRVKLYLQQNFRENISLTQIAAQVNMSPSYFSRVFSEKTGKSFTNYLTENRIEHAKKLLIQSNSPISNISEQSGYKNQYYFSNAFKKLTGLSPIEWRKQHKQG